jgi:uncharacterized protein
MYAGEELAYCDYWTGGMKAAVTGASSGIGEVFARKLAARGYDLILIARRQDRLKELVAELQRESRVAVEVWQADLVDEAGCEEVARRVEAANLDLLVNNAGFGTMGFFHHADLEGQLKMHRLHVLATVRLTHAVLPGMVARNSGGVINVSSVASYVVGPGNASYCATKSWMSAFTEGLHLELAGTGSRVRVQALCPGLTRSEFHQTMGASTMQNSPAWLWMTADRVVEESLHGLERGKLFVVPGLRYKLAVLAIKLLPKTWIHRLTMRSARKLRPENFGKTKSA